MAVARELVAALVASSAQFRTWTGTANEAAALARVYPPGTTEFTRPCAFVWQPSGTSVVSTGHRNNSIEVGFEADYAAEITDQEALDDFDENVSAILSEMRTEARSPGRINLLSITMREPPSRARREDGNYVNGVYLLETGFRGPP